jgi:phosphatidylethanolamine/phosphatidyl-N-methylethanolamine N-methyltransferase
MKDSFVIRKRRNGSSSNPLGFFRELELELSEHLEFLHSFFREPASVGALSPSSRYLAKAMIQGFQLSSARTVVELGPGTGSFTGPILERIGKGTTFITMELDPHHARCLSRRFRQLIVHNDTAERLPEYLALHGRTDADYIISGIPWANLSIQVQQRIMDSILASISPDGIFTTFSYWHARWLPKARLFRRNLQNHFARVETSRVIWCNLPPAFVYRCSLPKRLDSRSESPASACGGKWQTSQ